MHKRELRGLLSAMLLGDSCFGLKYNKHRKGQNLKDLTGIGVTFSTSHNINQEDYCLWKVREIDKIFEKKNLPRRCTINYYNTSRNVVQFKLAWTKYFRIIYPKIYKFKNGKYTKGVQWLLNQIYSDKHLFIWFGDDGTEYKQKRKHKDTGRTYFSGRPLFRLDICGFTFGEAQIIKQWFESNYKVSPKIIKHKESNGNIHPTLIFRVKEAEVIWRHIRVYAKQIPSMRKKFSRALEIYN